MHVDPKTKQSDQKSSSFSKQCNSLKEKERVRGRAWKRIQFGDIQHRVEETNTATSDKKPHECEKKYVNDMLN